MAPFKVKGSDGQGAETTLAAFVGNRERPVEWNLLAELSRRSTLVAEQIKKLDPGKNQPQWREHVEEMRASAASLTGAVQKTDEDAAREAARRLKASCVKCHVAFRD
jgi:cytochrome c556